MNEFAAGKSQNPPSLTRRPRCIRRPKHRRVRYQEITGSDPQRAQAAEGLAVLAERGTAKFPVVRSAIPGSGRAGAWDAACSLAAESAQADFV
jgi:hypothetical protein